MNTIQKIAALVATSISLGACGFDNYDNEIASLQSQVDSLQTQVNELTPVTVEPSEPTMNSCGDEGEPSCYDTRVTTPSTITPAATLPPSETLPLTEEEVREDGMSACQVHRTNFDTYVAELGVPEGAFFYGECDGESMWFGAYQGTPADIWYANWERAFKNAAADEYEGELADWPELPQISRHPAFDDAVTLGELNAQPEGIVVCRHYGQETDQYFLVDTSVKAWNNSYSDTYWGYVAVRLYNAASGGTFSWPATDMGIMPHEDGVWSIAYVSLGACPVS